LKGGVSTTATPSQASTNPLPPNYPDLQPGVPKFDPRGFPPGTLIPGTPSTGSPQPPIPGYPPTVSTDVRGTIISTTPGKGTPQAPITTPRGGNFPTPNTNGDIPAASPEFRFTLGVTTGAKQVFEDWFKGLPQNLRDEVFKKYGPGWLQQLTTLSQATDKAKAVLQNINAASQPTGKNPYDVGVQLGRQLANDYVATFL
jgi:hypothetical protein